MSTKKSFRATTYACFGGYIVQAIVTNYAPLLFITFQNIYGVSLSQLSFLVTATFAIQLIADLIMSRFAVVIGIRTSAVLAHGLTAAGLILMSFLPEVMGSHYAGLLISVCTYSLGASIIEVVISPIMEACPSDHKAGALSLLHSFYCWGSAAVILLSSGFFLLFGIANWRILALLWAVVPTANGLLFTRVPIGTLPGDQKGSTLSLLQLLKNKVVLLLLALMIAAGAAELAVAQWASAFAEAGLGVSKALGDLLGPTSFALCMGAGRAYYALCAEKLHMKRFMLCSALLCAAGYLIIVFSPWAQISLLGCGLVGFGVAVLWPGALSMGAATVRQGGTGLFALLACGGDIGCTLGPTVVGLCSAAWGNQLKSGIFLGLAFPVAAFLLLLLLRTRAK